MSSSIEEVSKDTWKNAQVEELKVWMNEPQDSDDWNHWWSQKFDNYQFLKERSQITTIYEAGCGPYAKNIEIVMNSLNYVPNNVILSDPLLQSYCNMRKSVSRFGSFDNVKLISAALEDFSFDTFNLPKSDLTICINVLDHVRSVKLCFDHLYENLNPGGILILGQDLTSDEDNEKFGNIVDPCHPIRVDEQSVKNHIEGKYEIILNKMLSREEGRNPDYHYGTLIFAGIKR
jgi:hypothetical protein